MKNSRIFTNTQDRKDYMQLITDNNQDELMRMTVRLENIRTDPSRKERLAQSLCLLDFYVRGQLGGQAFTRWACMICGKEEIHANTCIPSLCATCAKKHNACVRCAGKI